MTADVNACAAGLKAAGAGRVYVHDCHGGSYALRILDNGPGFGEETIRALEAQMDEIRRTRTLPSLKINGMGILHVFIRFCLLYDNQFLFRLENNPEGGACVTIGASIHESEV